MSHLPPSRPLPSAPLVCSDDSIGPSVFHPPSGLLYLYSVQGFDSKTNDILFLPCPPVTSPCESEYRVASEATNDSLSSDSYSNENYISIVGPRRKYFHSSAPTGNKCDLQLATYNRSQSWDERHKSAGLGDSPSPSINVVVFPGDISNLYAYMDTPENIHYREYCLENICETISERFKGRANVILVVPERQERGTFSCFDNFVPCLNHKNGDPPLQPDSKTKRAIPHLDALLWSVSYRLTQEYNTTLDLTCPLVLVGFSKGGVVVNQVVRELSMVTSFASHDGMTHGLTELSLQSPVSTPSPSPPIPTFSELSLKSPAPTPSPSPPLPSADSDDCRRMYKVKARESSMDSRRGIRSPIARHLPVSPLSLFAQTAAFFSPTLSFLHDIHYVDVGCGVPNQSYPVNMNDIIHFREFRRHPPKALARECACGAVKLTLHGTPFQWRNPSRPWVATNIKNCIQMFKNLSKSDFVGTSGVEDNGSDAPDVGEESGVNFKLSASEKSCLQFQIDGPNESRRNKSGDKSGWLLVDDCLSVRRYYWNEDPSLSHHFGILQVLEVLSSATCYTRKFE